MNDVNNNVNRIHTAFRIHTALQPYLIGDVLRIINEYQSPSQQMQLVLQGIQKCAIEQPDFTLPHERKSNYASVNSVWVFISYRRDADFNRRQTWMKLYERRINLDPDYYKIMIMRNTIEVELTTDKHGRTIAEL